MNNLKALPNEGLSTLDYRLKSLAKLLVSKATLCSDLWIDSTKVMQRGLLIIWELRDCVIVCWRPCLFSCVRKAKRNQKIKTTRNSRHTFVNSVQPVKPAISYLSLFRRFVSLFNEPVYLRLITWSFSVKHVRSLQTLRVFKQ